MKTLEEIKGTPNLLVHSVSDDGGTGEIFKAGKPYASVIWSYGGGWEHVSIAPYNRRITPDWDDMCRLKDMFFYDYECCVQYHPPKAEYVDNVPNCLHIWASLKKEMPRPPAFMVGIKPGQSRAEYLAEIDAYFAKGWY